ASTVTRQQTNPEYLSVRITLILPVLRSRSKIRQRALARASRASHWKRTALRHIGCRVAEDLVGARSAASQCLDDEQAVRAVAHCQRAGKRAHAALRRAERPLHGRRRGRWPDGAVF